MELFLIGLFVVGIGVILVGTFWEEWISIWNTDTHAHS